MAAADEHRDGRGTSHVPLALAWLIAGGSTLPLVWGWVLPALLAAVLVFAVGRVRTAPTEPSAAGEGGFRVAVLASCVFVVVIGVFARALVGLVAAFPASAWGLVTFVVAAGVLARLRRLPGLAAGRTTGLGIGLAVLVGTGAAVAGHAHARAGSHARGWAQSGPIHGIHPFQATAIIIDGYGPFDVAINDFVEPDGSRGYGPEALGEAFELALHRIADVHFSDGPARARKAFGQAWVEVAMLPPIRERRDREPARAEPQPRLTVWSGTTGAGSSVEFVCPGRIEDPRSPRDSLMQAMCPSKYATEATAGLGLTGRWPGYAEGRGGPRWGRLGRAHPRTIGIAVAVVLVVLFGASWATRWTRAAARLATANAGALVVLWGAGIVAAVLGGALWHAPAWPHPTAVAVHASEGLAHVFAGVVPLLVLVSGVWVLGRRRGWSSRAGARRWDPAVLAMALWMAVATVWAGLELEAMVGLDPWSEAGAWPFAGWVIGLAEATAALGLDVEVLETVLATWSATVFLAAATVALQRLTALWARTLGARRARDDGFVESRSAQRLALALVLAVVVAASGLAFSRATAGGTLLLPGTAALAVPLAVLLYGPCWRPGIGILVHAGAVVVAALGLSSSMQAVDTRIPAAWIYLGIGALAWSIAVWPATRGRGGRGARSGDEPQ